MTNKNNINKKIISLTLTFLCVFSITFFSIKVSADETTTTLPNGIYQIKNAQTELYMSVMGNDSTSSQFLRQYPNTYEQYQQFIVKNVGNGEYIIQPIHLNNMVLNLAMPTVGMTPFAATYVEGSSAQLFYIEKNGSNNYYSIKNKESGRALAIYPGDSSGASISQYSYISTSLYQHWYFEQVGVDSGVFAIQQSETSNTYISNELKMLDYVYVNNTYESIPNTEEERDALFKLIYRPNTFDYVIRSMSNNKITLSPYALLSYVEFDDSQSTIDSVVSDQYSWKLSRADSDSFYIWALLSNGEKHYMRIENSNKQLKLTTNIALAAKFTFHRCYEPFAGIEPIMKNCHIVDSGSITDLSTLLIGSTFYSTDISINAPRVTYSVTNIDGSPTAVAQIENANFLKANATKAGMVKVNVSMVPTEVSFSTNFYVKPNEHEEFFLLLHDETRCTALPIGFVTSSGAMVERTEFTYSDNQIWQRIPSSTGYYYIKNVSTGQYLLSPTSTEEYEEITLSDSLMGGRSEWEFSATSSGRWKIRSKYHALEDRNLYLNIWSYTIDTLIQGTAVENDSYLDEFNIIQFGSDVVYQRSLKSTEFTDISVVDEITNLAKYYDTYSLLHQYMNVDVEITLDLLDNAKIMIINGHGNPQRIVVHDDNQRLHVKNKDLFDSDVFEAQIDLGNIDIVFFAGCSTAGIPCDYCNNKGDKKEGHYADCPNEGSTEMNITESAYMAGAEVSIGWTDIQYGNYMNDWIDKFIEYLNTINMSTNALYTVDEALSETNRTINLTNANLAVYYGNGDFRLSD